MLSSLRSMVEFTDLFSPERLPAHARAFQLYVRVEDCDSQYLLVTPQTITGDQIRYEVFALQPEANDYTFSEISRKRYNQIMARRHVEEMTDALLRLYSMQMQQDKAVNRYDI